MVNTKCVEPAVQGRGSLPLASLNHISVVCRSLESSLRFYRDVLGFISIRRPGSFDFDGAWYVRVPAARSIVHRLCFS
jgi:catechol 2,3-dioxygenase-like lactoylglutathione lyase family enzyme